MPKKYNCNNEDFVQRKPVYCESICGQLHLKKTRPPIGNSGPAYEKHLKNVCIFLTAPALFIFHFHKSLMLG